MTRTVLPRLGVSSWDSDGDLWPGRTGMNAELANLNANAAIWGQGTTAARPVAAYAGRFWFATDTLRLWYDNGTAWTEASPVGGGGTPTQADIGDTGVEGASRIAARADHQHAVLAPDADPVPVSYAGVTGTRGASATVARADHAHTVPALPLATAIPPAVDYLAVGAIGTSTSVARADHTHAATAAWRASASGSATTAGDGTQRPIALSTVDTTQCLVFTALSAGRITVPYNGIYLCTVKGTCFAASAYGQIAAVALDVNNVRPPETQVNWELDNANTTGLVVPAVRVLAAGDGVTGAVSGLYSGTKSMAVAITVTLLQRL